MSMLRLLLVLVILLTGAPLAGAEVTPVPPVLAVGALLHDEGPFSDYHESGLDLNLELEFPPGSGRVWKALGSPRPHAGVTLNFVGDTSTVYAGLTYLFSLSPRFSAGAGFGLAVHDGPLHKEPVGCQERSDCGFGTRILPRFAVEGLVQVTKRQAVSLYYGHMSHAELLADENEGIDHLGIRFRRGF